MQGHSLTAGLRKLNRHWQSGGVFRSNANLRQILYDFPLGAHNSGSDLTVIANNIVKRLTNGYVYLNDPIEESFWRTSGAGFVNYGHDNISVANTYELIYQATPPRRAQINTVVINVNTNNELEVVIVWRLDGYVGTWDNERYYTEVHAVINIQDRFTANPIWNLQPSNFVRIGYEVGQTSSGYAERANGVSHTLVSRPEAIQIKVGYPI